MKIILTSLMFTILWCFFSNRAYCKKISPVTHVHYGKTKFPFSSSAEILLISFSPPEIIEPEIIEPDGKRRPTLHREADKAEVYGDTLGHKGVREIIHLSAKRAKALSGVLNKTECSGLIAAHACYSPRNAVLFVDKSGNVIAELEVCFECLGFEVRPHDFYINDVRECMYYALKKVFADAGIKYGIANNE